MNLDVGRLFGSSGPGQFHFIVWDVGEYGNVRMGYHQLGWVCGAAQVAHCATTFSNPSFTFASTAPMLLGLLDTIWEPPNCVASAKSLRKKLQVRYQAAKSGGEHEWSYFLTGKSPDELATNRNVGIQWTLLNLEADLKKIKEVCKTSNQVVVIARVSLYRAI